MKKIALIPSYEPDNNLIEIIQKLFIHIKSGRLSEIVVVNDGSSELYNNIFNEASKYATVLSYLDNCGKGYALKYGIKYIRDKYLDDYEIVTMDSDGQHTVSDALKILDLLEENPNTLILGKRIRNKQTPIRSRFGNGFSSLFFKLSTGTYIYDTQTGLRAFSYKLTNLMLNVEGSRYEYEMNVLYECANSGVSIKEIEIETIYINKNSASHFNTLRDSYLIYKQFINFALSSVSSFLLDYILFTALYAAFNNIIYSNVTARLLSAAYNFLVNRNIVFKSNKAVYKSAIEYILLASFILLLNTFCLNILVNVLHFDPLISKIIVEVILFLINWIIQKTIVFKKKGSVVHV